MMRRAQPTATTFAWAVNQLRFGSSRNKVVSVEDAVYLVPSNSTITVAGFVAQGCAEYVLEALGNRFKETGEPKDLTLLFGGGPGDTNCKGLNHFAHPGMLKRAIGGHYGQTPMLGKMAQAGAIEAYFMPMGCVSRLVRCAASHSPGHISKVGFGTMMDPELGGGKLNSRTTEDIVRTIEIDGEKFLYYKAIPIDVAIIRGTTADAEGNITYERESLYNDNLHMAMAGRSRRGLVIAQVERLAAVGSLKPQQVRVPGTMVDCVVVAPEAKHQMSYWSGYNPTVTGEVRQVPKPEGLQGMELDERKVIARRACLELQPDQVVNLGIGMPEGVAMVADEEHCMKYIELTTEPGVHGGVGLSGHNFGPATNPSAIIEMHSQFDFYNGGGLDICFLGNAETDAAGNVNVTRAGPKLTGPGGFIDISQCTPRVNLMGSFTAVGLEIAVENGKLKIVKEGKVKKFVKKIKETTFSGRVALQNHQHVNYITERAVFTLTPEGIELTEIAPGIDLQRDVLDQMEFKPLIREPLGTMDLSIFAEGPMNLKEKVFGLQIDKRIHQCSVSQVVYIDLRGVCVYDKKTIADIDGAIRAAAAKAGGKIDAIVSLDQFDVAPHLIDEYAAVIAKLEAELYKSVRRVSSAALRRHKLASALSHVKGLVKVAMNQSEAYTYITKAGLLLSRSEFGDLFKTYSNGSSKISPDEMKKLMSVVVWH